MVDEWQNIRGHSFSTFERDPGRRLMRWAEMKFEMRSAITNDDPLSSAAAAAGRFSSPSVPEDSRRVNTNRPPSFFPSPSPSPRPPPPPPIPVLDRRRLHYYRRHRHLRRRQRQQEHSLLFHLSAKLVHEVNTESGREGGLIQSPPPRRRPSAPPSKFTRITATAAAALIAVPSSFRSHGKRRTENQLRAELERCDC